jgi:hypothetical protein
MLTWPLTMVPEPMGVAPSKKLTVPEGAAPAAAVMRVAVRTVGLSRKTGLTELVRPTVTTLSTTSVTVLVVAG